MASSLLELLPADIRCKRALDVGTGTGTIAELLSARSPDSAVVAIDLSREMLYRAREKSLGEESQRARSISFVTADLEELPFLDASFDLVLSNLTYQWSLNLACAFGELYRLIVPGGLVVMNTLTSGTLLELKESFASAEGEIKKSVKRPFLPFTEVGALQQAVLDAGFELSLFDEREQIREYSDMWELLRVLKMIGAANPMPVEGASLASGALLKAAARIYKSRFSLPTKEGSEGESVRATYKTVFLMAKKPL